MLQAHPISQWSDLTIAFVVLVVIVFILLPLLALLVTSSRRQRAVDRMDDAPRPGAIPAAEMDDIASKARAALSRDDAERRRRGPGPRSPGW